MWTDEQILQALPDCISIEGDWQTRHFWIDGRMLDPRYSLELVNHSPDGFNWGYGGSGPAQLALAVLLEFLDDDSALGLYQNFKWAWVAQLRQGDIDGYLDLRKIVAKILRERKGVGL